MKLFTYCKTITSQKFYLCGNCLYYKRNLVHFHGLDIINTANTAIYLLPISNEKVIAVIRRKV